MNLRIGAAALTLALTLVAGAQGHSAAPSAIKIGAIFDRSGPTSDVGVPYSDGVLAYVAYVNSRGGIKGRKIQLLSQDTSYNVARSEAFQSASSRWTGISRMTSSIMPFSRSSLPRTWV